jgi:hypothetical protein
MTLLIHGCSLRSIYSMADSKEPHGDQVADQDSGGDDEAVRPREWNVVVHRYGGY